MLIREQEFQFKMTNADNMEKAENAIERFTETLKNEPKFEKQSQKIRFICHAVFEYFNDIFGDGADTKIFGKETDLVVCLETMFDFLEKTRQDNEKAAKITEKYSKYLPARFSK